MILLVSGADSKHQGNGVGRLIVPGAGHIPRGPWAADNGAFAGFDESAFLAMLDRLDPYRESCLFVACPDVVGDAAATLALFQEWGPRIIDLGYPVAFVLQDGIEKVGVPPWDHFDAAFIGGTTLFKMGPVAARMGRQALAEGKWLHMGRVNTIRRIVYANSIGCDSIDGTSFSRWSDIYIPRAVRMLPHRQLNLEDA